MTGAITGYIDVAQITLYAFWGFFAALVFYLRREDKREGYPLESDRSGLLRVQGWPAMPKPKIFILPHGGTQVSPRLEPAGPLQGARPTAPWPGAPLEPTGNPLVDGVGPAAYALRAEEPDVTFDDGMPRIQPLRAAEGFYLDDRDPDPRGLTVVGADGVVAGKVVEAWIDRTETVVRYLEAELTGGGIVLVPVPLARIDGAAGQVRVRTITAAQFADVPRLANPDVVTLREEDRITGYFAGGQLYAKPERSEPLI